MNPSPPASSRASTFSTDGLAPDGNRNFFSLTAGQGIRWVAGETGYAHAPTNATVEGEAFGLTLTQLLVPGNSHQVDADVRRLRYGSVLGSYNPEGSRLFLSPEYRGAGAALLCVIEVTTSVGRQSAC